jgi:cell wall-associated NlpC family hydrolase
MILENDIVVQARTWLGTPFHHQARLKRVGCDCLGLIIGVVDELDLKDKHGQPLAAYEVPIENAQAGDLALFNMAGNPQHLAILTDYENALGMIHCYAQARRVVEHRLDDDWKNRLVKVFRWHQSS